MVEELIDDPIKLIEFCNKHIRKLEMGVEQTDSPATIAKLEGHLVKWSELLEKAIHQAYQQGRSSEDITRAVPGKKGRLNA